MKLVGWLLGFCVAVAALLLGYLSWRDQTATLTTELGATDFEITQVTSERRFQEGGCGGRCEYDAANAFDGDRTTAWSEGVDGDGVGESLGVTFARPIHLRRITVVPGWQRGDCLWLRNGRPAELRIALAPNSDVRSLFLPDAKQTVVLDLDAEDVTGVTIAIAAVHSGRSCEGNAAADDTLISEITFYALE